MVLVGNAIKITSVSSMVLLLVCNLTSLWLEISVQFSFFPFRKSSFCCFYICTHFTSAAIKWCNSSFFALLNIVLVYDRTNVLCCKERSPQKNKYSNSKVREENIAVIYYLAMMAVTRKFHFSCVLLLPSYWWCRQCGWELAVWDTPDR